MIIILGFLGFYKREGEEGGGSLGAFFFFSFFGLGEILFVAKN